MDERRRHRPLAWIPTAYLAEGIPFALVIWVAGTLFKDLGHSDTSITLATASIGLAWSLKPLWAPFLDMYRTKKFWVIASELTMALLLFAIAWSLRLPNYFQVVVAGLWLLAFVSATQDICIDGVYITALDKKRQAAWIGVQGMCWNVGRIFATAVIVWLASALKDRGYGVRAAWAYGLGVGAIAMLALAFHHALVLPTGTLGARPKSSRDVVTSFTGSVRAFFAKPALSGMLAFVFFYRAGEGFLLVEAPLFLQAPLAQGGLGLTLAEKAFIDGTVSTTVSIVGGVLGGAFVARYGLRRSLVFLAVCVNLPHVCYVYLSQLASAGVALAPSTIQLLVSIEKFGYSFGFVGNMLYMMQQIAPGKYKMTHYAFATALMNLMLVPTQMLSGPLADALGYKTFFLFVMAASIPSLLVAWKAPFPNSGDEEEEDADDVAPEAHFGEPSPPPYTS